MIEKAVMAVFLGIESVNDLKAHTVRMISVLVFAVLGVGINIFGKGLSGKDMVAGVGVGMLCLFIAKVTNEEIGYGDGWILCTTGIYLGGRENFVLFFAASIAAAVYAVFLLAICKKEKKTEIAFVPFLFAVHMAEMGRCLLCT